MKNDNYKTIPLSSGFEALVSNEDYEMLAKYKWSISPERKNIYAVRNRTNADPADLPSVIRMHRVILQAQPGTIVDHVNLNTLDNRRENLRFCNKGQNNYNRKPSKGKSSQYKGVAWNAKDSVWMSYVTHEGKRTYLGTYKNERDAVIAYNVGAKLLHGEFARLNDV